MASEQQDAAPGRPVTRLAPSPTGALHLGNARTFLINWAMARQRGWRIVLRIEDLDTPRTKVGADVQAIDDLRWLGIDWDAGPTYQLADLSPYEAALDRLRGMGVAYPCTCSRKEIEQAQSAPHAGEHELRYPGTCRGKWLPSDPPPLQGGVGGGLGARLTQSSNLSSDAHGEASHGGSLRESMSVNDGRCTLPQPLPEREGGNTSTAWRVVAPTSPIRFHDRFRGEQRIDVDAEVGDFVIATKANLPAYQLAVVVDDARQRVTDVVRGDDLVASAARQLWLYRLLRVGPPPRYWHLPLVVGPDGRRLAKRHGDTRISHYREQGVSSARLIALLARWSGIDDAGDAMTAAEFAERFDIDHLPLQAITCTPEDHTWLTVR